MSFRIYNLEGSTIKIDMLIGWNAWITNRDLWHGVLMLDHAAFGANCPTCCIWKHVVLFFLLWYVVNKKKQGDKQRKLCCPPSFPSILRAPCVASKSAMALETLLPVAASYSACQFRSEEVDVVVQVCTGACSKEIPRYKATPDLSSLKVGWLHMHECLQCGNDPSWKLCVLLTLKTA